MKIVNKILKFVPTAIVVALIAYFSLFKNVASDMPDALKFKHFDKVGHFIMYLTLAVAYVCDSVRAKLKISKLWLLVAVVAITLYGGFIELMQQYYFYPRSGDWLDLLADFLGAVVGTIISSSIILHYNKQQTR